MSLFVPLLEFNQQCKQRGNVPARREPVNCHKKYMGAGSLKMGTVRASELSNSRVP
jgi:hypothetical protein